MACICCFFDNEFQKNLKEQCFGGTTFLENLLLYKHKYLKALKTLATITECSCQFASQNISEPNYINFTNDVFYDFLSKSGLIAQIFDNLIDIYSLCKNDDIKKANIKLESFMTNYCTNYSTINGLQMCHLFFRGREKGYYDEANINQYFHLPFSNKGNAKEQRFSAKGTIMFYLARSMPTVLQELGKNISEVNFSLFVPKYSWVCQINNSINRLS
jgi:hypothetical protein